MACWKAPGSRDIFFLVRLVREIFMGKSKEILNLFVLAFLISGAFTPVFAQFQERANSIGMEFVLIPAGTFQMGCDKNFERCYDWDVPQHKVEITKAFYLGKYPVTQKEWVAVMGDNPSKFKGEDNPVENISWDDIQIFIQKLNAMDWTGSYRLPTEAEWEYAARARTVTIYSFGDDNRQLRQHAWYNTNSNGRTHPVGELQPNPWGLYDMHGNVFEWVQDWHADYPKVSVVDPKGPFSGSYRVLRGGSWNFSEWFCRSADRHYEAPSFKSGYYGFRLVFVSHD